MSIKHKPRARRVDRVNFEQLCPKFGRGPSCKYWIPYTEKSNFTALKAGVAKPCFLEDLCLDTFLDSPYCTKEYEELFKESPEKAEQRAQQVIKNQRKKKDDS